MTIKCWHALTAYREVAGRVVRAQLPSWWMLLVHPLLHRHAGLKRYSGRSTSRMAGWARHYAGMSQGGRSVSAPPVPVQCSASKVCLPPEVERLLLDVVADGFVLYWLRTQSCAAGAGRLLPVGALRRSPHHPVL
jgi:hypothetical protein